MKQEQTLFKRPAAGFETKFCSFVKFLVAKKSCKENKVFFKKIKAIFEAERVPKKFIKMKSLGTHIMIGGSGQI